MGSSYLTVINCCNVIGSTWLVCAVTDQIHRTVQLEKRCLEIEEKGVKLRLTIVDTPGFNDSLDASQWCAVLVLSLQLSLLLSLWCHFRWNFGVTMLSLLLSLLLSLWCRFYCHFCCHLDVTSAVTSAVTLVSHCSHCCCHFGCHVLSL